MEIMSSSSFQSLLLSKLLMFSSINLKRSSKPPKLLNYHHRKRWPLFRSSTASIIKSNSIHSVITIIIIMTIMERYAMPVHSMGTLLHAGPSCIIKPTIQHHQRHHHNNHESIDHHQHYSPVKHRGICYSTLLCKQKGGVAIGKCGLGNSCCVFPQTCNSISVRNSTYFTSPQYPSFKMNKTNKIEDGDQNAKQKHHSYYHNDGYLDDYEDHSFDLTNNHIQMNHPEEKKSVRKNQCSLTIHRMPGIHPICRIRLDFIEYEIEGHQHEININEDEGLSSNCNVNNDQQDDYITIKAMHDEQMDIIEPICRPIGKVGHHVIVDVRKHIGPFILTVHTNGSMPGRRRWNILINQIECNRSSLPTNSFRSQSSGTGQLDSIRTFGSTTLSSIILRNNQEQKQNAILSNEIDTKKK